MRLGGEVIVVEARSDGDIEAAFATLVQRQAGALMVGVVPHFTYNSNNKIVALAERHKIPAMYPFPIYAFRGGLMSYGADFLGMFRQVGPRLCSKVLMGAKPADLPLQRPNKFSLSSTSRPPRPSASKYLATLLARADEVIE